MPSIQRSDPPYLQVVRHIREQIQAGELRDGDPIPPVRQLARDWDISHATAAKVVQTLRSEGLVEPSTGVGTVVRTVPLHRSAQDRVAQVERTGRIYPSGHYARILSAELAPAPDQVATVFGVEPGAAVIRRVRTTYSEDDEPLSTSQSWFDGSVAAAAPRLLEAERIKQGTVRYLLEQTGRSERSHHAEVMHAASRATEAEATELQITPGESVERTRSYFRDDAGELLEYGESTYRAELWAYYSTAPRESV